MINVKAENEWLKRIILSTAHTLFQVILFI